MPPKKGNGGQKKKKSAAGPQRGFSTVSVAKKEILIEEVIEEVVDQLGAGLTGLSISGEKEIVEQEEEWSLEAMEKHDLQVLMDKIRPDSKKEISRMLKVVEYEKRIAKTYPFYSWVEGRDLQRRIIALALASSNQDVPAVTNDGDDKVVAKVASLFGILEQLGFTLIEECLRSIKNLDLDDALEWLFLRLPSDDLNCEGIAATTFIPTQSVPPSPRTPFQSINTPTTAAVAAPSPTISSSTNDATKEADLRSRILSYQDSDDESTNGEESDPNRLYADLKLRLSELQRSQVKGKGKKAVVVVLDPAGEFARDEEISQLQQSMKKVEKEYMFKQTIAEGLYRTSRAALDSTLLSQLLASTTAINTLVASASPPPVTDSPVTTVDDGSSLTAPESSNDNLDGHSLDVEAAPSAAADVKDDETSSEGGDIFGTMLDEMPSQETNDVGTVISVVDFALNKSFSGKTPQMNLQEVVRRLDRSAVIIYRTISRSRAFRAAVNIRWDTGKIEDYEMQDIACWDQTQAYNYISTIALFNISSAASTSHKQLPPVYKDLWDELVAKKTLSEDESYRDQLKLYKSIAESRWRSGATRDTKLSKTQISIESPSIVPARIISEAESSRIAQELSDRQAWPSYQEMLQHRATLPIANYRSFIMATIDNNQCVVLCGETGCGKSTQVPSFILEHEMRRGNPVKVFCTEPRRISAISLAQRVSAELGESPASCGSRSSLVGYSIRLDSKVSASSRIIYATTGIVLRMFEGSESLADATHLIIDEVHERSIDSDFLLIILKQILKVRKDLKVILMSATVDADKIAAYMGNNTPVITVPGRTFPVSSMWLEDVVELTGYRLDPTMDSPYVSRGARNGVSRSQKVSSSPLDGDDDEDDQPSAQIPQASYSKQTRTTIECMDQHSINFDLIVQLLENLCFNNPNLIPFSAAILVFMPSLESIRKLADSLDGHPRFGTNEFRILPLHSMISNDNQGLVFNIPPQGVRKIVISTNLAETGVTIPDITTVIDTGKHREMRYDEKRQISRLVETFVAQSNASQRRGRAGRVQEGLCFHLFSKHRHDTIMAEHPQPEMLRLSLQDLALRIKIMKIGDSIEDVLLQALDPPAVINIQRAIASLIEAKALTTAEEITPLGRHLAKLPMDVHLGKFLIVSCLFGCLDAALTITAALNSKTPWLTPFGREAEADLVKRSFKIENSDFLTLYNAYCLWRDACGNGYEREFTRKNFLSQQNLQMIEDLRQQYFSLLCDIGFVKPSKAEKSPRMGKSRVKFVRVPDELDTHSRDPKIVMATIAASMYPKLLVVDPFSSQMKTLSNSAPASIHPSSVNFTPGQRINFDGAKFIVYFTAMQTKKLYVWESGSVDERAIYLLTGSAEFHLYAHSMSIDRKIRSHLEPKSAVSFKILRQKYQQAFNVIMKNPASIAEGHHTQWLDLMKEALVSKKVEELEKKRDDRPKVKVSIHRNA